MLWLKLKITKHNYNSLLIRPSVREIELKENESGAEILGRGKSCDPNIYRLR